MGRTPRRLALVLLSFPLLSLGAARGQETSLRSLERVRLDCLSDVARREVTLFANGTVRLRERAEPQSEFERPADLGLAEVPEEGELRLFLGELTPEELEFYLRRLAREDLSETEDAAGSGLLGGAWVDRCVLELDLPEREERRFAFGRYDSLSLALSRVLRIVEELPTFVELEEGETGEARIPSGYRPKRGDVLERADGNLFEVLGLTVDEAGVELQGLDQPLTVFVSMNDLRAEFRSLVRQAGEGRGPIWRRTFGPDDLPLPSTFLPPASEEADSQAVPP